MQTRQCPRCTGRVLCQRMVRGTKVVVDVCEGCGGVWFDAGELPRILSAAVKDLEAPFGAQGRGTFCPACHKIMSAFLYPQTHVTVDLCEECNGVWLDGNELSAIATIRTALKRENRLRETAPLSGIKGWLIRRINEAIAGLREGL